MDIRFHFSIYEKQFIDINRDRLRLFLLFQYKQFFNIGDFTCMKKPFIDKTVLPEDSETNASYKIYMKVL